MEDSTEVMQLCRLCLVADQVNIPIFEEHDDTRQIQLKISSCLPVTVSQEDNLPQKICDNCLNKLEMLHTFRNISADSEKKLLAWLNKARSRKTLPAENQELVPTNIDDIEIKEEKIPHIEEVHNSEVPVSLDESSLQQPHPCIESQEDSIIKEEKTVIITDEVSADVEEIRQGKKRGFSCQSKDDDGVKSKISKSEQENPNVGDQITQPIDFIDVSSASSEHSGPSTVPKSSNEGQFLILPPVLTPSARIVKIFFNDMRLPAVVHSINQLVDSNEKLPVVVNSLKQLPNNVQLPTSLHQEHNYVKLPIVVHSSNQPCNNTPVPTIVPSNQMLKSYSCNKCSKFFTIYKDLRKHNHNVHLERKWPCSICGRKFKWRAQVKQHQLSHSTERTFKCNTCGKAFKSEFYLKFHIKQHKQEFQYICEVCNKGFVVKSYYDNHKAVHSEQRFKCEHCNTIYKQKQYYLKHLETHKPDYKPNSFTCTVCNAKLKTKSTLRLHMRTHDDESKYICDVCGKLVTDLENFRAHVRTHSGEKPYMCDFCGHSFNRASQLKVHRYIHTKEKPHVCSICQQRFTQRSSLTVHLRNHSGERPYKCGICEKGFVTRTLLKMHMKKKHGTAL